MGGSVSAREAQGHQRPPCAFRRLLRPLGLFCYAPEGVTAVTLQGFPILSPRTQPTFAVKVSWWKRNDRRDDFSIRVQCIKGEWCGPRDPPYDQAWGKAKGLSLDGEILLQQPNVPRDYNACMFGIRSHGFLEQFP